MTPRQVELARHALGLNRSRMRTCRNHFVAGPGHADWEDWQAMVAAGCAWKQMNRMMAPGDVLFHLTRAGAEQALLPGDVLDPEEWG